MTRTIHVKKVPRDLWQRIRLASIRTQKPMRDILIEALAEWLKSRYPKGVS